MDKNKQVKKIVKRKVREMDHAIPLKAGGANTPQAKSIPASSTLIMPMPTKSKGFTPFSNLAKNTAKIGQGLRRVADNVSNRVVNAVDKVGKVGQDIEDDTRKFLGNPGLKGAAKAAAHISPVGTAAMTALKIIKRNRAKKAQ